MSTAWRGGTSARGWLLAAMTTAMTAGLAMACRRDAPAPPPAAAPVAVPPAAPPAPAAPPEVPARALPAPTPAFATWPMPNAPASGLPNPARLHASSRGFVTDEVTGLTWQRTADARSFTWAAARAHCDALDLAGFDDWRLLTRIELASIVDVTHTQPSIDQSVFPKAPSDWFWTASVDAADPGNAAWYVYFYFGYPKTDPAGTAYRARCVRSSAPPAQAPRYRIEPTIVRDDGTGLTWQRAAPARPLAFEAARAYCAGLRLGGQAGWRVPSLGELLTLVDERTSEPAIDKTAFPRTPAASFWTSTPFADTPAMAWHVMFGAGNALYGLVKGPYRVRCVR